MESESSPSYVQEVVGGFDLGQILPDGDIAYWSVFEAIRVIWNN